MYTKRESSRIKEEFWTAFGKYMSPVPSSEGMKINWVNYKIGVKDIYFFMEVDSERASVGIRISHADLDLQKIFFEEFEKLRDALEEFTQEELIWKLHAQDEHGKTISLIYSESANLSIYRKDDWPGIISFFKPRIIALDAFWANWKYGFEELS
jgi:hypothetical protein